MTSEARALENTDARQRADRKYPMANFPQRVFLPSRLFGCGMKDIFAPDKVNEIHRIFLAIRSIIFRFSE